MLSNKAVSGVLGRVIVGSCSRNTNSSLFLVSSSRYFSDAANAANAANSGAATPASFVDVSVDSAIAVVSFNKKPVNTLSYELLDEFNKTLARLEKDKSVRGLILTSSIPRIFSAGLDITELYNSKPERLSLFWGALQQSWIGLYGSRLATAAAINGETLAGGCLLSMSCDYRVMAEGKFRIGLNETKLGIVAPTWFMDTMINTIGFRNSDKLLQLGALVPSNEALKIGLVDELVPEQEVVARAKAELLQNWLVIPDYPRHGTKKQLRQPTIDKLVQKRQEDIDKFIGFISAPPIQAALGQYLAALKKK